MFNRTLLLLALTLLAPQLAAADSYRCAAMKNAATARYARCTNLPNPLWLVSQRRYDRCTQNLERAFARADKRDGCSVAGGSDEIAAFMDDVQAVYKETNLSGAPLPVVIEPVCDPSQTNLLDYEAWRREEGYWVGEYTLIGADGDPFVSSSWNYPYDHYKGFIHIDIAGADLDQRNVFLYPPQDASLCNGQADEVKGNGTCGLNGNEKIFSAAQSASDCEGNLAGPFQYGPYTLDTTTTISGDDTVVYQVRLYPGGPLQQNQLTTLPVAGKRVRSAQGFNPFTGEPSYVSFYRETRVTRDEFYLQLEAARTAYNILPEDECGWNQGNDPSGVTCDEHFMESAP